MKFFNLFGFWGFWGGWGGGGRCRVGAAGRCGWGGGVGRGRGGGRDRGFFFEKPGLEFLVALFVLVPFVALIKDRGEADYQE